MKTTVKVVAFSFTVAFLLFLTDKLICHNSVALSEFVVIIDGVLLLVAPFIAYRIVFTTDSEKDHG